MRILIKRETRWEALSSMDYDDEDELQELLREGSGELVPAEAGDVEVVFAREVATDSGPIDLVGIGSSGSITVMECKLARDHKIKREVVGQVLDYAATLWKTEVDRFIARFAGRAGADPFDSLRVRLVSAGVPWDEEACRSEVARRLRDGDFRLLIAVDSIDSDLRRIIEFVNTRGSGAYHLQLVALAFPRFKHGETQILVPETFGDEISPPVLPSPPREWAEADVFNDLAAKGEEVVRIATEFRDWALARGYQLRFSGDRKGGFMVLTVGDAGAEREFVVLGGMVGVYFQRLVKVRPFDERSNREELLRRFGAAFGRDVPLGQADTSAFFTLTLLADPAVRAQFEMVIDEAMAKIAEASTRTEAPAGQPS